MKLSNLMVVLAVVGLGGITHAAPIYMDIAWTGSGGYTHKFFRLV